MSKFLHDNAKEDNDAADDDNWAMTIHRSFLRKQPS